MIILCQGQTLSYTHPIILSLNGATCTFDKIITGFKILGFADAKVTSWNQFLTSKFHNICLHVQWGKPQHQDLGSQSLGWDYFLSLCEQ